MTAHVFPTKRSWSLWTALALTLFVVLNNWIHRPSNILSWDVYGYYLYLPQAFIQDDLTIQDTTETMALMRKYESTGTLYQAMKLENGNHVMKYSLGMAVTYSPFFAVGHGLAKLTGEPQDGFSWPYQRSIFWGEILISILGLWVLRRVLLYFFSEEVSSMVLLLIVLATNYTLHVTMVGQNAMSHNVLFTLYAVLLWATIRWEENGGWRYSALIGLSAGFAMLIRPTEVVALIIPVLWNVRGLGSLRDRVLRFWERKGQVLVAAIVFLGITGLQVLYWKMVTGKFLFNSYGGNAGEGLNFDHPYLTEVLFSFRKGWLLYTPIMVLAMLGLISIVNRKNGPGVGAWVFLVINIYLISCWSTWWYGPSFSQRPFIASYPLMALGLGGVLVWISTRNLALRMAGACVIALMCLLNLFQTYQYYRGIIDMDRMTKAAYFHNFFTTDPDKTDPKLLLVNRNRPNTAPIEFPELYEKKTLEMNRKMGFFTPTTSVLSLSDAQKDTLLWFTRYHDITEKDHAYLEFFVKIWTRDTLALDRMTMTAFFENKEWPYAVGIWESKGKKLVPGVTNTLKMTYLTPEVRYPYNMMDLRFSYPKDAYVAIHALRVDAYTRKE